MHRTALLAALDRYAALHAGERSEVERIARFVRAHSDCFERTCVPGHVTGSAWILSPDRSHFLLTHHEKLGRWLQLGGHADGDPDSAAVALREAREESGMHDFAFAWPTEPGVPFDIDVHEIPARGDEPAHLHHDVRYLLIAAPNQPLRRSSESRDLAWFPCADWRARIDEESQRRMARKAEAWTQATDSVPWNTSTSGRST